jgi:hypothetical protein
MRKEFKALLFYIGYIILSFIVDVFSPSGVCSPGLGAMMLLAYFPFVIFGSFVFHLFFYLRNKEVQNRNCLLMDIGLGIGFYLFIQSVI